MSVIGIFLFGAKHAHNLGVCGFFLEIHEDVLVFYYVEGFSYFDALGGFVGSDTNVFAATSELVWIVRVTCWY